MTKLNEKIFNKIQKLCDANDLKIAQLEVILDMGTGTIRAWAKSMPRADKLQLVADYFNVSVDYLFGRDEQEFEDPLNDKGLLEIQRARENMSPQDKDRMNQMLRLTFQEAFKNDE